MKSEHHEDGLMVPKVEIFENHETQALIRVEGMPAINRYARIDVLVEAFIADRLPNKTTARGYRRYINEAF